MCLIYIIMHRTVRGKHTVRRKHTSQKKRYYRNKTKKYKPKRISKKVRSKHKRVLKHKGNKIGRRKTKKRNYSGRGFEFLHSLVEEQPYVVGEGDLLRPGTPPVIVNIDGQFMTPEAAAREIAKSEQRAREMAESEEYKEKLNAWVLNENRTDIINWKIANPKYKDNFLIYILSQMKENIKPEQQDGWLKVDSDEEFAAHNKDLREGGGR